MTPQEIASLLLEHHLQPDFSHTLQQLAPQFTRDVLDELIRRISDEQLRNAGRALQFVEVAEEVATSLGTAAAQGLTTWVRGNVLYFLNRYREALDYFQKAESFYQLQGDALSVAGLQVNQVAILRDLADYPTAFAQETKARAACEAVGERAARYLANLEMTIGLIYEEMGQPETALATYDRGRAIFVQRGDFTSTALIDVNRAYVLEKMDRFAEAESLLKSAVSTLSDGGYDQEVARAELNLGILTYRIGRYQEALHHLDRAYQRFAAIPLSTEMAIANLERAFVYGRLHLFRDMVTLAAEAEKTLQRQLMRREQSLSLIYQGIAYQQLGLVEMAERTLNRARRYLQQQKAQGKVLALDFQRARLYWAMNRPERAGRIARRVLKALDPVQSPSLAGQIQLLLARCAIAKERWQEAHGRLETVHKLAQTYHLAELEIEAVHVAGLILEKTGRILEALQQYQQAIQKTQHLQAYFSLDELRLGFGESKQPLYQDAVRVTYQLVQTGQISPAHLLTALNQAHSAPLVQIPAENILENKVSPWQTQLMELRRTWQWYQSSLDTLHRTESSISGRNTAEWQQQLAQLETEITELMRRERVRLASNPGGSPTDETPSPEELLKRLQISLSPDERLLHYFVVQDHFQVLLITPEAIHLIPNLTPIPHLKRLMKAWRFYIQHTQATWQTADPHHQHAQMYLLSLYQTLFAPLCPHLARGHRLYLVLPPDWHDIPMAALFDGQRYLVESYWLSYLSAPGLLQRKAPPTSFQEYKMLVVGFSDNGRLPHAPTEAQQIASSFPTNHVTCLLEEEATWRAFQPASQGACLIHLATHALFRPDNPLFSWMRLADDHVTVGDLYHLKLPNRPLVVLSACETGKGQVRGGGLFGMGRVFLAAGATGLVVTLWPVADRTTAELMNRFYHFLPQHVPSLSLCKAQREAIRDGRSPFAWAGFTFFSG